MMCDHFKVNARNEWAGIISDRQSCGWGKRQKEKDRARDCVNGGKNRNDNKCGNNNEWGLPFAYVKVHCIAYEHEHSGLHN